MVKRTGRKPNPANLRLIEGTHRDDRHGPQEAVREVAEHSLGVFGAPIMPEHFEGDARAAWERYIAPAWWLDASREPAAIIACELWQELRADPSGFPAAKHSQLRAYLAELGLTDERNRFGIGRRASGDDFFE